jgi:hypothetical protein
MPGIGQIQAASANVDVEITVIAAAKCGRLKVNAIFLEMVTSRYRHEASK